LKQRRILLSYILDNNKKRMKKTKSPKRIIIAICVIFFTVTVVLPVIVTAVIYKINFNTRYETYSWLKRSVDDFGGLKRDRYSFQSNKGQTLIGYKYYKDSADTPKAVIVTAHGLGGGGHNSYMNIADYFADNGYIVFAYDATGNDESDGKVGGLPQGVIDLDNAIRFVKNNDDFKNLPIVLFGHSWGAYSSGAVLNVHSDIKAAVLAAGFNESSDMIENEGSRQAGFAANLMLPYAKLIDSVKFGKYASMTCINGFENTDAAIMIIHSEDDAEISYEKQFVRFKKLFGDDPRFVFIDYKNRGHDGIFYSGESKEYAKDVNKKFAEYASGHEITVALREAFFDEYVDMSRLFELDEELMDSILRFYDENI